MSLARDIAATSQPSSDGYDLPAEIVVNWPVEHWRDTHVLLAVSGGADSVALLRAMHAIKQRVGGNGRLLVGHVNHGLRASEADSDETWLVSLCSILDIPLFTAKVNVANRATRDGDGVEAAARAARYEFLSHHAEQHGARYVVTAHTSDDHVETVLHRIIRGTGLAGLAGIPTARPLTPSVTLVRPMRSVWRRDVLRYLHHLGQNYRTDQSNTNLHFIRNRLRHELLPSIRDQFNSNIDRALLQLSAQALETQQYIEQAASVLKQCVTIQIASENDGSHDQIVEIDCLGLAGEPEVLIREVIKAAWVDAGWPLQAMGFAEWHLLAGMAAESCGLRTANLPANVQAVREGDFLRFRTRGLA